MIKSKWINSEKNTLNKRAKHQVRLPLMSEVNLNVPVRSRVLKLLSILTKNEKRKKKEKKKEIEYFW